MGLFVADEMKNPLSAIIFCQLFAMRLVWLQFGQLIVLTYTYEKAWSLSCHSFHAIKEYQRTQQRDDACDQSVTYSGIEAGDKDIEAQEDNKSFF